MHSRHAVLSQDLSQLLTIQRKHHLVDISDTISESESGAENLPAGNLEAMRVGTSA